jgi:hypothetical protein
MPRPLLVIHLLRGMEKPKGSDKEMPYKLGMTLPALGLHFPGTKDSNAPKHYISYRLNRVAQAELDLGDDDLSDDDNED